VRIGYADPPYPGMAHYYIDHPDYAGEVDHAELVVRLEAEYDGWVLHTASSTLKQVLEACPEDVRVAAWVKPFASFKKGIPVAYAWEPVIFKGGRRKNTGRNGEIPPEPTIRDWIAEPITLKRGLTGAKPQAVCWWMFSILGLESDDELVDLFPGSGAVGRAWDAYQAQGRLIA
jgi:hypothetical protein